MTEVEEINVATEGTLKSFRVRHLGEKGLGRALQRAVSESKDGWPVAMIQVKDGTGFPPELEILAQEGWTLFEAWTRGKIEKGMLEGYVSLKGRAVFEVLQTMIPLRAIESCHLSYYV